MIYSWIGISIFALAIAYSMAKICSACPLAGGQYSRVAILAPPKVVRGIAWVTGWTMPTGILHWEPRTTSSAQTSFRVK